MSLHSDKVQDKKSQSIANTISNNHNEAKSAVQFQDNRPEAVAQRKLQEMAEHHSAEQYQPIQKKENNTGLPDNLKSGIENLSGLSMDDVNVHYNSDKPAQLNAHAYAQGTDIHLGSGQEKHLPHEAWHVVQQKQGRVKPTMQMKGGVNVNDDKGLEQEADLMGAKSLSLNQISAYDSSTHVAHTQGSAMPAAPVQRYKISEQYMISQNDRFAVTGHGTPHSTLFVKSMDDISTIKHVKFEAAGSQKIDSSDYIAVTPKYKSREEKQKMEEMYCGKFARHATGKTEAVQSGDAPAGESLYVQLSAPAGAWENHYAPVIITDEGDRGTFETAAGLYFMFFGIYGQATKQSFAYKTEIAGMMLGLQKDTVGKGLQNQLDSYTPENSPPENLLKMLAEHKEERLLAEKILYLAESDDVESKLSSSDEQLIYLFLKQIDEHRSKRYILEQELLRETIALQQEQERISTIKRLQVAERERVAAAQAAQRQRALVTKISAVTGIIATTLLVLYRIFG